MPLFASFSASSSRSLGLTSGAPPGPPTIDSSSSTATTYTINFTPVLGSFDIARFEYSLNGGAFTGSISSSATSHTVTGLVPSTAYTLQIRAVDSAGQISDGSNVNSRSTTAEIAPSAPTVTVTQLESGSGTPINATRLSVSFTAAPAGTYSVAYHQYRVYRGATLITDWTTTPVGAGVAFPLTGLNTATAHTVDVRGVATGNGTTFGSVGSGTATTDTEIANSAPSVTIVSQDTANVTFDRSNSTGGTYGVSYYQYLVVRNADGVWVASGTLSTSATRYTIATGVSPDQYFTIYLAAISLTSGTQGASGSAVGQLEPGTPTIGTLNWQGGMSANGTTAYLYAVAGSYNYDAYLVINGSTQVAGTHLTSHTHSRHIQEIDALPLRLCLTTDTSRPHTRVSPLGSHLLLITPKRLLHFRGHVGQPISVIWFLRSHHPRLPKMRLGTNTSTQSIASLPNY